MNALTEVVVRIRVDSFAPPLDECTLAKYLAQIQTDDILMTLFYIVIAWRQTTPSKEYGRMHPNGRCLIVPLSESQQQWLSGMLPSWTELARIQKYCDGLKGSIRDAAFHLLWHVKELAAGREPITQDKLVKQ